MEMKKLGSHEIANIGNGTVARARSNKQEIRDPSPRARSGRAVRSLGSTLGTCTSQHKTDEASHLHGCYPRTKTTDRAGTAVACEVDRHRTGTRFRRPPVWCMQAERRLGIGEFRRAPLISFSPARQSRSAGALQSSQEHSISFWERSGQGRALGTEHTRKRLGTITRARVCMRVAAQKQCTTVGNGSSVRRPIIPSCPAAWDEICAAERRVLHSSTSQEEWERHSNKVTNLRRTIRALFLHVHQALFGRRSLPRPGMAAYYAGHSTKIRRSLATGEPAPVLWALMASKGSHVHLTGLVRAASAGILSPFLALRLTRGGWTELMGSTHSIGPLSPPRWTGLTIWDESSIEVHGRTRSGTRLDDANTPLVDGPARGSAALLDPGQAWWLFWGMAPLIGQYDRFWAPVPASRP